MWENEGHISLLLYLVFRISAFPIFFVHVYLMKQEQWLERRLCRWVVGHLLFIAPLPSSVSGFCSSLPLSPSSSTTRIVFNINIRGRGEEATDDNNIITTTKRMRSKVSLDKKATYLCVKPFPPQQLGASLDLPPILCTRASGTPRHKAHQQHQNQ